VGRKSEETDRVLRGVDRFDNPFGPRTRVDEVPFMQEQLTSKRDLRHRFQNEWNEEQRRAWIGKNGVPAAMELLGGVEPERAPPFAPREVSNDTTA
jgi:hypothetical protein